MDTEADLLALSLIEVFAAALRDLNEGNSIPVKWREYLEREVGMKKMAGRPRIERVTQRDLNIARRMLQHYLAVEGGESAKNVTTFAQELADEYRPKGRAFTAEDIFKTYSRYQNEVLSEEVCRRLKANDEAEARAKAERAQRITKRLQNGETLGEILVDPAISMDDFVAIRNHQIKGTDLAGPPTKPSATDYPSRRQAILQWLNYGMNLGIHYDPVPVANLNAASRKNLIPDV
ncbi:MAG: hypothetical protein AABM64_10535 [Pseudomonadota bacterium]